MMKIYIFRKQKSSRKRLTGRRPRKKKEAEIALSNGRKRAAAPTVMTIAPTVAAVVALRAAPVRVKLLRKLNRSRNRELIVKVAPRRKRIER